MPKIAGSLSTRTARMALGALAAIGLLGSSSVSEGSIKEDHLGDADAMEKRASEMLDMLAAMTCEDYNCEFSCGNEVEHIMRYREGQGNDGGEIHWCAASLGGCQDHTCDPEFAQGGGDLQLLEGILGRMGAEQLTRMAGLADNLMLNLDRSSIQVVGCNDRVLVSIPMSAEQQGALKEALH